MTKEQVKVKGYKVFNSDWTCRDYQYTVGKTFKHKGEIELCGSGFHFCEQLKDCFSYYSFNPENKVAEVLASGQIISGDDKSVTNTLKIVKEVTWNDVLNLVNIGKANTGFCNTGDRNTGNRNTGDCNTGFCNTGNRNTGEQEQQANRNTVRCQYRRTSWGNQDTGD